MKPALSLKRRSIAAGAWAGGGHVLGQAVRLASNLILARLLVPEAFGLMALISSMMMALNLVSDIGTGTVVVQSQRGADPDFLNTAWTLQIIRGFALWSIGLVLALLIVYGQSQHWFTAGTVYADPRLPLMVAVATFGLVINGLVSINWRLAERNLDLRRTAVIDLVGGLGTAVVMVAGAVMTGSVWALVFGSMAGTAIRCVCSHIFLKGPRGRVRLERSALSELLGKGKWVLVSTLLGFAAANVDRLILGSLVDGTTLGLYSIALNLTTIASSIPSLMLMKVAYPAISEVVRERIADLPRTYQRLQRLTDVCLGVMAGMLLMAGHSIVDLLYDDRYQAAGPILATLAIGTVGSRLFVVDLVYTALARNSLVAALLVPRVVVLVAGLPIGFSLFGLEGALAAIVASQFAHWPAALYYRAKQGLGSLGNDAYLPIALVVGAAAGWVLDRLLTALLA